MACLGVVLKILIYPLQHSNLFQVLSLEELLLIDLDFAVLCSIFLRYCHWHFLCITHELCQVKNHWQHTSCHIANECCRFLNSLHWLQEIIHTQNFSSMCLMFHFQTAFHYLLLNASVPQCYYSSTTKTLGSFFVQEVFLLCRTLLQCLPLKLPFLTKIKGAHQLFDLLGQDQVFIVDWNSLVLCTTIKNHSDFIWF